MYQQTGRNIIQTIRGHFSIDANGSSGDQLSTNSVNYTPKPSFSQEDTVLSDVRKENMNRFQELLPKSHQNALTANIHAEEPDALAQKTVNSTTGFYNVNSQTYEPPSNSRSLLGSLTSDSNILRWAQRRLNTKDKDTMGQTVVIPQSLPAPSSLSSPSLNIPISLATSASLSSNVTNILDKDADAAGRSPFKVLQQQHDSEAVRRLQGLASLSWRNVPTNKDVVEVGQPAEVEVMKQSSIGIVWDKSREFSRKTNLDRWACRRKLESHGEIDILYKQPLASDVFNLHHKIKQAQTALLDNDNILVEINTAIRRREDLERQRDARKREIHRKKFEWSKEAAVTIEQYIMGSYIRFKAGLNIQHVVCGADASRVLVKNLPPTAERSEILELFTQQGVAEENLAILRTELAYEAQQATVLGKAAEVEPIALGLQDIEFGDRTIQFMTCREPIELYDNCCMKPIPYIRVLWRKPQSLRTMLITYDPLRVKTGKTIKKLLKRINPYPGTTLEHNHTQNLITLSRVPTQITVSDILVDIGSRSPYNFIIALHERQYRAQASQWADLCNMKDGENVWMDIVQVGVQINISVLGNNKKAVGSMKVRTENLARGYKLDRKYWHYHFSSKDGERFINDLFWSTGAYIRCDDEKRCLSVYGTPGAVELAKGELMNEVARLATKKWDVPLERSARVLGIFCNGGVDRLRGLFENNDHKVALDIPNAKLILNNVDLEEAIHYVKDIMRVGDAATSKELSSYKFKCPVCFDLAMQPIQLACRHCYCSSCLRHYLLSSLENGNIPLTCIGGDGASCGLPFSIPLIKQFVPPHLFECLLEIAFRRHIEQHPRDFKVCPTPDCPQIYRATAHTNKIECCSCFNTICTGCHEEEFHIGLTCSERQAQKKLAIQDRLYDVWAMENDVKQCGACETRIQKAEGCNHITCKCGAHMCWICMKILSERDIYPHLAQVHDGG